MIIISQSREQIFSERKSCRLRDFLCADVSEILPRCVRCAVERVPFGYEDATGFHFGVEIFPQDVGLDFG